MGEYPALDVSWTLRPDDEHIERLLAEVAGHHPTAVEERANGLRIFFSTAADRGRAAVHLIAADPSIDCAPVEVPDEDWAARSQSSLAPVRVGDVLIVPVADDPPAAATSPPPLAPAPLHLFIRPSMGFGTGHHASTRLCLTLLQRAEVALARVLDVGTGSGILAIAAWRLGASDVAAIDVDPDAIASARENVALNDGKDAIDLQTMDIAEHGASGRGSFDVVVANLTGATLIRMAQPLVAALAPAGRLLVGGVLETEDAEVSAAFESLGCQVVERLAEDEWIGLSLTSPTSSTRPTAPRSARRRHGASSDPA